MTQSEQNIERALKNVAAYKKGVHNGAVPMGVHLEGPFLSAQYMGAQPPEFLKAPDIFLFERWQSAAKGLIKTVTVAPELQGAEKFIKYLVKHGVVPSAGHTAATHAQMKSAMQWGLTRVTHTFNAQSPLKHREIGVAGAALLYDGLYTELIADCIHVSVPAIKLLMKCKPKDKLILITDALRAKGFADGESELGGQKVFVKNGEARLADGTLAGSVLKMNVAIKNLTEQAGADFLDAVNCATINPATALGLKGIGEIRGGNVADFTVLGRNYEVFMTVRDGKVIYRA
jgi:N-acetylglucosamine-6-phosphate deacetylase